MSNRKSFDGKVVIITDSSSGIGEAIAIYLSKIGASVVITGRDKEDVKRVTHLCQLKSPNGSKALDVIGDISVDSDAKRLIDHTIAEFGKIDVLINNAATNLQSNINDENLLKIYELNMRLNLRSAVYLTQLSVPYLEKTKGNIINISSIAAIKPIIGWMCYCMSQSALDMFTKCLAIELGPKGVRVNSINTGSVGLNIEKAVGLLEENNARLNELFEKCAPLGNIGKPQHIANAVSFLASNDAQYMTGATMVVDGGAILTNFTNHM